ncbi:hypothetical protein Tco_1122736 [Tanacetum coccineum]|uniref:Uncharacterized protein n=1 Tax=Tanacetum coccineum TaxID=301880 RepID=A0ABQ5J2H3_9ASTR
MSVWVQLLIMPCCVLSTFVPTNRAQRRSGERERCQFESISHAILRWRDPVDRLGLVSDRLAELTPSLSGVKESDKHDEANVVQCKRKLGDGHFTAAFKVLTSSGVAPSTPKTLHELEAKHPYAPLLNLSSSPLGVDALCVHKDLVLNRIRSFPKGTSCGRNGLRAQHLMDILGGTASTVADDLLGSITLVVNLFLSVKCPSQLGEYITSAPLTPLVKPGGGIRPIAVGTVWRRRVSKVASSSIGNSMNTYLQDLQFGVNVPGGCEAVLHSVNRLVESKGNKVGHSMLLVEFCYARLARLYYDDSILWSCQRIQQGDPLVSLDEGFCQDLTLKRVSKTISLMEAIYKLHDPQFQFDQALRDSLEKVVTAVGSGFGDWQWRLATPQSSWVAKTLIKTGIDSHGYSFQHALDVFNSTCNVDMLSVTTCTSAPQMMKTLAKCYFGVIEKDLVSKYSLSLWHVAILSYIRAPHAQDFLFTIRIDGLGQRMNHRQFRYVLCYRLSVPTFSECSLCPSCNVHQMDQWGDHAVHCCSEVGVKFRHNLVRDILVDICSKGKYACLDVTGISPFAGTRATSWAPGVALHNAVEKKKRKYASICEDNGYKFIPFAFSTFGEFDTEALDTLSLVKSILISHSNNNAKSGAFIFHRGPFLSLLKDHSRCIVLLSSRLKDGGDKVYLGWLYKAHQCARFNHHLVTPAISLTYTSQCEDRGYNVVMAGIRALALDSMMFWNFKVSKFLGIFCSVDVIGRLMVDSQRPAVVVVVVVCILSVCLWVPSRTGNVQMQSPEVDSATQLDNLIIELLSFLGLLSCNQMWFLDADFSTCVLLLLWKGAYGSVSVTGTIPVIIERSFKMYCATFIKIERWRALALDSMMFWNFKVSKILGIFCSVDVIGQFSIAFIFDGSSANGIEEVSVCVMVLDDDCKETESRVSGMDGDNELVDDVWCYETELEVSDLGYEECCEENVNVNGNKIECVDLILFYELSEGKVKGIEMESRQGVHEKLDKDNASTSFKDCSSIVVQGSGKQRIVGSGKQKIARSGLEIGVDKFVNEDDEGK